MPVKMDGYEVVYNHRGYTCLAIEPLWLYEPENTSDSSPIYPTRLRVAVLDHNARYAMFEDEPDKFAFIKEVSNG